MALSIPITIVRTPMMMLILLSVDKPRVIMVVVLFDRIEVGSSMIENMTRLELKSLYGLVQMLL